MSKVSSDAIGFGFHPSKKWKLVRPLVVALLVALTLSFFIASEATPLAETWDRHPGWFVALGIFLILSAVMLVQLVHVLNSPLALVIGESGLHDHRRLRSRFVPYDTIEIFSPEPEKIFDVSPLSEEFRAEAGIDDFIAISCRLDPKSQAGSKEDFVFFERIEIPQPEMKAKIVSALREKISKFDLLIYGLDEES